MILTFKENHKDCSFWTCIMFGKYGMKSNDKSTFSWWMQIAGLLNKYLEYKYSKLSEVSHFPLQGLNLVYVMHG